MACAKIKHTKYMRMRNINDNAVQDRLSENYLTRKIIARNILDTKYSRFTVHVYIARSRLDRSFELHANAFREDDVDNMRVKESEVM